MTEEQERAAFEDWYEARGRSFNMNDALLSKAFTALLEQVEFVLTVTVPMTHQQEEAWPELRKRAKAARAAASSRASEWTRRQGGISGDYAAAAATTDGFWLAWKARSALSQPANPAPDAPMDEQLISLAEKHHVWSKYGLEDAPKLLSFCRDVLALSQRNPASNAAPIDRI